MSTLLSVFAGTIHVFVRSTQLLVSLATLDCHRY